MNNPLRTYRTGARAALLMLAVVVLVSYQYAPPVMHQRRDSGIFAYTGRVIREGGLPYVDAWDNKLPGVFYIDAAAFWLFGTNRWALWIMEAMVVTLTALLMFRLQKRLHARRAEQSPVVLAWLGALLLVMLVRHPALVSDVNFTEPYALLFQMIVWTAGYAFLRQPDMRTGFAIGFASGAALLIKQTTVGAAFALVPAILLSRHPVGRDERRWRYLAAMIAGGLVCLGIAAAFLAANGILDDTIEASFLDAGTFHDWVGRGTPWIGATIWRSLTSRALLLAYGPLLPFLLIGSRQAIERLRMTAPMERAVAAHTTLGIWAVITFVANLVLANITGRAYEHYYVPLIPSAAIVMVMGIVALGDITPQWDRRARRYLIALLVLVPAGSSLGRFWMADWDIIGPTRIHTLATYAADHTEPGDRVWVWGANTVVNFQSGRDSPTQYTYGYPLIVPGATSNQRIAEVVADLNAHPPALIIDSTISDGDRVPPLDPAQRAAWWQAGGRRDVADLTPIYQFVADRCVIIDEIEQAVIYGCF